jgi:hypothetical protein
MRKWTMVECRASFFEASRNTLLALQHLMREPFPFIKIPRPCPEDSRSPELHQAQPVRQPQLTREHGRERRLRERECARKLAYHVFALARQLSKQGSEANVDG